MGILKNYEILNPFLSATNDSLERLKPGFEAPVSIVASIGKNLETPSRNRTVLLGLIRDFNSPMATRFEVRSPNPHSNTYLVIATLYQVMLDGMKYAVSSGKCNKDLENEFKKSYGDEADYLDINRMYHSELDVFDEYSEEERSKLFGKPPATVWDNLKSFSLYSNKLNTLYQGNIFNEKIINSYYLALLKRWTTEINNRIIPQAAKLMKNFQPLHKDNALVNIIDKNRWETILNLKIDLMKDTDTHLSLFTRLRNSIKESDFDLTATLQIEVQDKLKVIKDLYNIYKRNLI